MEDYLNKLDYYINMMIEYNGKWKTPKEDAWLRQARAEMEIALLLLIKDN